MQEFTEALYLSLSLADIADFSSNSTISRLPVPEKSLFSHFFPPSPGSASFLSNANARAILRARQNFTATDQINFPRVLNLRVNARIFFFSFFFLFFFWRRELHVDITYLHVQHLVIVCSRGTRVLRSRIDA